MAVEETLAANTFGTIVHDTLESVYTPFIGQYLKPEPLIAAKADLEPLVQRHFAHTYSDGDFTRGKNLLAYHVILKYVSKFIDMELKALETKTIKILALEQSLERAIHVPGLDFPITLRGKLDRVDRCDGITRIIDYKTGKVTRSEVELVNWEDLVTVYDHSKAFQLLCYAYMYDAHFPNTPLEAGIVSFKNLKEGILHFATKESARSRNKNTVVDQEVLTLFQQHLHALITEITDPTIPFVEKAV